MAELKSFVLIVPEGLQNSWNAKYCCGHALKQNINDIEFLHLVIQDVVSSINQQQQQQGGEEQKNVLSLSVKEDFIYGVGWSNGGYMVTMAAKLFLAISPISGHRYDVSIAAIFGQEEEEESHITRSRPIGLFMHHAVDDPFVNIHGCCNSVHCCCGISNYDDENVCVSAFDFFREWSTDINHCELTPLMPQEEQIQQWGQDEDINGGGVQCFSSAGCGDSLDKVLIDGKDEDEQLISTTTTTTMARVNTTFCIHPHGSGHFNTRLLQKSFPMTEDIANFFAKDACEVYHDASEMNTKQGAGVWDYNNQICICNNGFEGLYCARTTQESAIDIKTEQILMEDEKKNDVLFVLFERIVLFLCISIVVIVFLLLSRRRLVTSLFRIFMEKIEKREKRQKGWHPVNTNEEEDSQELEMNVVTK